MNGQHSSIEDLLAVLPQKKRRNPTEKEKADFMRSLVLNRNHNAPTFTHSEIHHKTLHVCASEYSGEIPLSHICNESDPILELEKEVAEYCATVRI